MSTAIDIGIPTEFEVPEWLDQSDDELAENFDAPEPGSFTPRINPKSIVPFRFELTPMRDRATNQPVPGGFGSVVKDNKTYLVAEYTAHIQVAACPDEVFVSGRPSVEEISIPFNRLFGTPNFQGLTGLGEMYRCLGLVKKHGATSDPKLIVQRLVEASANRAIGNLEIGWKFFDKDSGTEYTTHPFKSRLKSGKHSAWPATDGKYNITVNVNGVPQTGREFVASLRLPKASK